MLVSTSINMIYHTHATSGLGKEMANSLKGLTWTLACTAVVVFAAVIESEMTGFQITAEAELPSPQALSVLLNTAGASSVAR